MCGGALYAEPLLTLENMPGAAQFMPDADSVGDDMGVNLRVRQCSGCGAIQLSDPPVRYYREVVRAAAYSPEMAVYRREQFAAFVAEYGLQDAAALEIGCGRGEYLSLLKEAGLNPHGLEFNPGSVAACIEEGLTASEGYLQRPDQQLAAGPFQAVFSFNFIEHMPDPVKALRAACLNLTDDGVGLLEVPNFDMILRDKLFSEFIGDHLLYFTEQSFTQMLGMCGFEVIRCEQTWHDYILTAHVRKRQRTDLSELGAYRQKIHADVHAWLDAAPGRGRVAVWGAGHQALAVMSLLGLGKRCDYVVDSAPFKQGRFTPASHLEIFAPSQLREDPVDAVLVMCASYSDEVARILRAEYDPNLTVAILREDGLESV
ncbi:putative type 11 methyltransferase [Magnetofaba australis IT-1]|uniref:Putative type 11 methyltransferase n=1 Tax=Magnetofaba australis IT-1 TaxID=1434232 RepID=A0A1Y2K2I5_9PROT|nr:putative type 11 methyltransferase [Magnetofaba australis IT-1]